MNLSDLKQAFYTAWATIDNEITPPYAGRLNQLRKDMKAIEQTILELEDNRPWWKRWWK